MQTGQKYMIRIDTGSTNNYINSKLVNDKHKIPIKSKFYEQTINGTTQVKFYVKINIFGKEIRFFTLDHTGKFDLIMGIEGLERIDATLHLTTLTMTYNVHHQLQYYTTTEGVTEEESLKIDQSISKNNHQEMLTFNTNVVATIRTPINTPFLNTTIDENFTEHENATIRKSSQGNHKAEVQIKTHTTNSNPEFSKDKNTRKKHTIDHRKLKPQTISDQPDINIIILSKLGKTKFFSKINRRQKLHQQKINQKRALNLIDRTKPKFKMKN